VTSQQLFFGEKLFELDCCFVVVFGFQTLMIPKWKVASVLPEVVGMLDEGKANRRSVVLFVQKNFIE
jgi:hypothetical protein